MPTYAFICPKCDTSFDEIRNISDYDKSADTPCPRCKNICGSADRDLSGQRNYFIGEKVESAEYNPGLGCVVRSKKDRDEKAKIKGLVEIGNDFKSGDDHHDHFEKVREKEQEKKWEDPKDFFLE